LYRPVLIEKSKSDLRTRECRLVHIRSDDDAEHTWCARRCAEQSTRLDKRQCSRDSTACVAHFAHCALVAVFITFVVVVVVVAAVAVAIVARLLKRQLRRVGSSAVAGFALYFHTHGGRGDSSGGVASARRGDSGGGGGGGGSGACVPFLRGLQLHRHILGLQRLRFQRGVTPPPPLVAISIKYSECVLQLVTVRVF
jgi:hypothetical protein